MPEFRVDVSDLGVESEKLIGQLAVFLEEEANVKAEVSGNEIVVKSEEAIPLWQMRKLLKDFLKKVNVKGKVKIIGGNNLIIVKSKGKPIFCGRNGKWIDELEKRLETEKEIVLLALGKAKYQLLNYLNKREDIEILKLETRYMKKAEKGKGLKAIIRRRKNPKTT